MSSFTVIQITNGIAMKERKASYSDNALHIGNKTFVLRHRDPMSHLSIFQNPVAQEDVFNEILFPPFDKKIYFYPLVFTITDNDFNFSDCTIPDMHAHRQKYLNHAYDEIDDDVDEIDNDGVDEIYDDGVDDKIYDDGVDDEMDDN